MSDLTATPSQTVGPFFHIGLDSIAVCDLVPALTSDGVMVLNGRVLDGDRQPVIDALIEIWQANEQGTFVLKTRKRNRCKLIFEVMVASPRMPRAPSVFAPSNRVVYQG